MTSIKSIKDRLKNKSIENGKTMQEMLTLYGLERTIYRLSLSDYKEKFTLKGGIYLYAIYGGDYARATTDADFHARNLSNDPEDIKDVFTKIFSIQTEDPLRYDIDSIDVKSITENKKYHGVNLSTVAYLDRTKIPISIDIGFDDVIYPDRVEMEFPVVLSDESPMIYAYSEVSSIAEKFEAIVSLAYDNSRFKDYYDIYVISTTRDFDGEELAEAVRETFEHRKTALDDIVAFESGFSADPLRQTRWNAFVKKKKAMISVSLEEAIVAIKAFLGPVADAVNDGKPFGGKWSHDTGRWI